MTIATGEPAGSTITTEPTRWSRISRATETALSSGEAVTTPSVMISLSSHGAYATSMSQAQHTPVVPLEAGAGPENPPCPACGEPLFGWIAARPGLRGAVSRCESCGLGVVGAPGDDRGGPAGADPPASAVPLPSITGQRNSGSVEVLNRASFSASLGGAGWAGLEPGSRYLFTVESVRRLVASRDQVVKSSPLGARAPASRRCGRRSSTASPSAATSRSGRSASRAAANRPRSAGSAGSTG